MTRHEFLAELHALLRPKVYLEIGVQHGTSLRLAAGADLAIGIDPEPLCGPPPNGVLYRMTSDAFFAEVDAGLAMAGGPPVDLAFIDGQHLVENALRDFANVERVAHPGAVIVFDDVLPRNQAEAARQQCPGDWTGDVWRVEPYLRMWRHDLRLTLVDTFPTGLLVVTGLSDGDRRRVRSRRLAERYAAAHTSGVLFDAPPVPPRVINRRYALDADIALQRIREGLPQ